METIIYNKQGKEAGKLALPETVFGLPWNADLVHQVIVSMQSNKRAGTAHTKNRGEVECARRKPWQQKGTGRARHGDIRSPIWKGGGVTHGPRNEKNYKKKINRKMKAKALLTVLSAKYKDGKVLFVDSIALDEIKTKDAASVMTHLSKVPNFGHLTHKKPGNVTMFTFTKNENLGKSFRNLPNVNIELASQMNPLDIANSRYIIIVEPKETIEFLSSKLA
jgi:large subunit ribosomal protein L4